MAEMADLKSDLDDKEMSDKERLERAHSTPLRRFLWTLPQPIVVFGGMIAVALSLSLIHI